MFYIGPKFPSSISIFSGLVPVLSMGSKCISSPSLYLWNRSYLGHLRFPFKHDPRKSKGVLRLSRIHDLFFESMINNRSVKDMDIPTSLRLGSARHYRSVDTRVARGLDIGPAKALSTSSRSTFSHSPQDQSSSDEWQGEKTNKE